VRRLAAAFAGASGAEALLLRSFYVALKGPPTNNIQMVRSGRRFVGRFRRVLPRIFGGAASSAPTGYCYGKARPGVESGSKFPHSTESRRGSVWRAAKATTRGNGDAKGRRCAPVFLSELKLRPPEEPRRLSELKLRPPEERRRLGSPRPAGSPRRAGLPRGGRARDGGQVYRGGAFFTYLSNQRSIS
jgi:hypothetical protein